MKHFTKTILVGIFFCTPSIFFRLITHKVINLPNRKVSEKLKNQKFSCVVFGLIIFYAE